jgi:hypothetical protein
LGNIADSKLLGVPAWWQLPSLARVTRMGDRNRSIRMAVFSVWYFVTPIEELSTAANLSEGSFIRAIKDSRETNNTANFFLLMYPFHVKEKTRISFLLHSKHTAYNSSKLYS